MSPSQSESRDKAPERAPALRWKSRIYHGLFAIERVSLLDNEEELSIFI
jgi:hypothetical protein